MPQPTEESAQESAFAGLDGATSSHPQYIPRPQNPSVTFRWHIIRLGKHIGDIPVAQRTKEEPPNILTQRTKEEPPNIKEEEPPNMIKEENPQYIPRPQNPSVTYNKSEEGDQD